MEEPEEKQEPIIVLLRNRKHYALLLELASRPEMLDADKCIIKGEMLYDLRQGVPIFTYNSAIINSQLMAEARHQAAELKKKKKRATKKADEDYKARPKQKRHLRIPNPE
jgi:hypothetical protein